MDSLSRCSFLATVGFREVKTYTLSKPSFYSVDPSKGYTLFAGFVHLGAGLACGFTGLTAGYAIGRVGDAVRESILAEL